VSSAPEKVRELVERFDRGRRNYKGSGYNETQVRREFIDPLFVALGWDVDNTAGYAETYKDVIHEDRLTIGGVSKAPDYSFRIGGVRKFFVEAKKPAVNLHDNPLPAYQLRRYAWNAKLPLSVLTDFDEFVVYDCRHQPKQSDAASVERILYVTAEQYLDRWSEIADVFSKESVLRGSFDDFALAVKGKRGTSEVDRVFLAEMEEWRQLLASNLVLRNSLTQPELNFAVQQIIDRLVFLRICEDRGIEPYGELQRTLDGPEVYRQLTGLFKRADDRYNSGLFHFQPEPNRADAPDRLTLDLSIDDSVLKRILTRLYYPASPYDFRVLPSDILGQVYERFLGQVIRLTSGGRAVVEPKPEVRKAGGVYYTPTYIVEHIVERTLAPILSKLNPRSASQLRILDPASGSGSFLLVAYDHLLKWHLDYYEKSKSATYRNRIYLGAHGQHFLTVEEKRRILLNSIYGVDIDAQAVEVTKLSLLLRVLEDESAETLATQLKLFHERALPDLYENVKCGNSLIGPDYFDATGGSPVDPGERERINAFSWEQEFPTIMENGGFDVIIGNPPYVFTREQFTALERAYYTEHFPCGWEKRNTYLLFMEVLVRLLRPGGRGGFIVPNSWLTIESAQLLRALYAERVRELVDLNYPVFEAATVEPSIFTVDGGKVTDKPLVLRIGEASQLDSIEPIAIDRSLWERAQGRFVIPDNIEEIEVVDAIFENASTIGKEFDVRTGLQAYEVGKGEPRQTAKDVADHVFDRDEYENEHSVRYLQGRDVERFNLNWSGSWMQYGPWLSQPRDLSTFTRPRVLIREITSPMPQCFSAVFTDEPFLSNKSVLTVLQSEDDERQLRLAEAILNSRAMSLCYRARAVKSARKIFPKIVVRNLRELPFPSSISTLEGTRLLAAVDAMLSAASAASEAKVPRDHDSWVREHDRLAGNVERAICGWFGLSTSQADLLIRITGGDSARPEGLATVEV
jgi:predicted type IV restriction endonuclease/methylase of polypeptide subunit release factors